MLSVLDAWADVVISNGVLNLFPDKLAGLREMARALKDGGRLQIGDILALQFPDNTFDRVLAEAVTMFVERPRAARELVRVCRPGGMVLTTEFLWRKPPTPEARQVFSVKSGQASISTV